MSTRPEWLHLTVRWLHVLGVVVCAAVAARVLPVQEVVLGDQLVRWADEYQQAAVTRRSLSLDVGVHAVFYAVLQGVDGVA